MDDHLPHRATFEVELADTVIRAFDLIGFIGVPDDHVMPHFEIFQSDRLEEMLMELHKCASDAMEHYRKGREIMMLNELFHLCATVEQMQFIFNVDVYTAMTEKLDYNAKRSDHKLVNRQAAGGKSF